MEIFIKFINSYDSKKLIILGMTIFFIQNILFVFVDIIILFIPSEIVDIIFFSTLWVDIAAGIVLSFGLMSFYQKKKKKNKLTLKLSYLFISWSIITFLVRILLGMNTGIPIINDGNLTLILFFTWSITSIYFSIIIYFSLSFFKQYSDTNFLIQKLYILINIIAVLLIIIAFLTSQSILSVISTDLTIGDYPSSLYNSIFLFYLGALAKLTFIPLLGIVSFSSFRTILNENLFRVSVKNQMKKEKMTYTPKKLIYK